jgi:hypothetical protein
MNDNGNSTILYETGTPNHISTPVVRDSNLILYYDFNEGSGTTALDRSGHSYIGTLNGPTYTSLTSSEQTLYYDASGADYISTPSFAIPNTGILTIEAWMKSKINATTNQVILGDNAISSTVGFLASFRASNANKLTYQYATSSAQGYAYFNDLFLNLDNQWIHIVIVTDYTNKTLKVYRNGVQFDVTKNLTTPIFPSTDRVKYIGAFGTNSSRLTDGSLDEVRIYNRVLGDDEVMIRYNQTKGKYQ